MQLASADNDLLIAIPSLKRFCSLLESCLLVCRSLIIIFIVIIIFSYLSNISIILQ